MNLAAIAKLAPDKFPRQSFHREMLRDKPVFNELRRTQQGVRLHSRSLAAATKTRPSRGKPALARTRPKQRRRT